MFAVSLTRPEAKPPRRARPGDAGLDLFSAEASSVPAGEWRTIDTGIAICMPSDCYARLAARSGLAARTGINVGGGVIDSSYRGNIGVILFNHSKFDFPIAAGQAIAQIIFEKIYTPEELRVVSLDQLGSTERGANGYGSSDASRKDLIR